MREGWKFAKLGDLAETRLGKTLPKGEGRTAGGSAYLRNVNVQWGRIDTHDLNTMAFTDAEKTLLAIKKGDVLICEGGEIGRAALVTEDMPGVYFQNAIHRVRSRGEVLPEFLAYAFEHLVRSGGLDGLGTTTTIAHLNQTKLREIEIALPPLEEQQRIVDLIESLDDAIEAADAAAEVNRAATDELRKELLSAEKHAEVPEMREILTLHYGKPMRDLDRVSGDVPVVGSSGTFGWHNASNVTTDCSIIVGRKGTAGSVTWYDAQVWATDTAFWVEPKAELHLPYLYQALVHADLPSMTAQTGVPGLNRDRAYSARIPVPAVGDQRKIAEILGTSTDAAQAATNYAGFLRATCSELLTVLLSGEHEIPESYDVDSAVQLETAA